MKTSKGGVQAIAERHVALGDEYVGVLRAAGVMGFPSVVWETYPMTKYGRTCALIAWPEGMERVGPASDDMLVPLLVRRVMARLSARN